MYIMRASAQFIERDPITALNWTAYEKNSNIMIRRKRIIMYKSAKCYPNTSQFQDLRFGPPLFATPHVRAQSAGPGGSASEGRGARRGLCAAARCADPQGSVCPGCLALAVSISQCQPHERRGAMLPLARASRHEGKGLVLFDGVGGRPIYFSPSEARFFGSGRVKASIWQIKSPLRAPIPRQ